MKTMETTLKTILIDYLGEIHQVQRKVIMDGSYYFVNLNGELRCSRDLNKPFTVGKLPRGAKKSV